MYGARLAAANLPGDGWRTQHDAIKWRIYGDAKEMGARARVEVYGLFAAHMPQAGRAQAAKALPLRKRQGMVPDFLFTLALDGPERELLFELKTLHYGVSTYNVPPDRCAAVTRRARALPGEYASKARELDAKFCGAQPGVPGPVERKLNTFDPVRGLVFGSWGEGSPDVDRLIGVLADVGATRHWRGMQSSGPDEAKGALAWLLRRRWAMTALRENARLKLDRLEYVGRGAAEAIQRRSGAATAAGSRARQAAGTFWRGPRARGWRGDR